MPPARRRRDRALVAAGQRVTFADKRSRDEIASSRGGWQADGWDFYERVGSVRWAYDQLARLAARCTVHVGWYPEPYQPEVLPDAPPILVDDEGQPRLNTDGRPLLPVSWPDEQVITLAETILTAFLDALGGPDELLSAISYHLGIPGETWICGWWEDDPTAESGRRQRWALFPGDAIKVTGDQVEIRTGPATTDKLDLTKREPDGTASVFTARVWNRHPRWPAVATSTLRALISDLEEYDLVRRGLRALHRHRLSSGILFVSDTLGGADRGAGDDDDDITLDAGDEQAGPEGPGFAAELHAHLMRPVEDEASDAGVVPYVVPAPPDEIASGGIAKLVTFDRPLDALSLQERDQLERLIAQGLPLPPEAVAGAGGLNHWTAWQIPEETFKVGVAPPIENGLQGVTDGVLVPLLVALGIQEDRARRVCWWYDPTDAVTRPDPIDVIRQAFLDGVIGADAYRKHLPGIEDTDAPTGLELGLRLLSGRGVLTAEATLGLLTEFGGPKIQPVPASLGVPTGTPGAPGSPDDVDVVPETGPPAEEGPIAAAASPSLTRAEELARRLGDLERHLVALLLGEANAAIERALERVGARARSRVQGNEALRASIVDAGPVEALGRLHRANVLAALGFDEEQAIRDELQPFLAVYQRQVRQAIDEAAGLLVAGATPAEATAVLLTTVEWHAAAGVSAEILVDLLVGDAMRALFDDVDLDATQLGEIDDALRVRPETLRRALAVAGGDDPQSTTADVGGLTGGRHATAAAAEAGLVREGYRWVYGPGLRGAPFPPHRALDGTTFTTWDDDRLSSALWPDYAWVGSSFFPGDHAYCQCDAEPLFVERAGPAGSEAPE